MRKHRPAHALELFLGVGFSLLASPAWAEGASSSGGAADGVAAAAASDDGYDSEIVVSARRRDENAQDVPIALSVVGAETLQATGNYSLLQIQQVAPSLQVFSYNPRSSNINIRGLGSNVSLSSDGLENGVGFYIDNVYFARTGQALFDLVDLQQIEVLRGPQGTLFGKNTTAGAINITSRKPSFEPEFSGEASLGGYGFRQLRGSLAGPLVDDLVAVRISGALTAHDGFVYNVTRKERAQDYSNWSVRGQLLITPSPDIEIRIVGDFSHQSQNDVLNIPAKYFDTYADGSPIQENFSTVAARIPGYQFPVIDPFARRGENDAYYHSSMDGYGVSAQVDWKLGTTKLTSITAYRGWDWQEDNDGDRTALPVFAMAHVEDRQRQFSQELRLASDKAGPIDYVAGLYYLKQTLNGSGRFAFGTAAPLYFLPTVPAAVGNPALNGFEYDTTSDPEIRSFAVFGQVNWGISDKLTLTMGLRYTRESKSGSFRQYWAAGTDLGTLTPDVAAGAAMIRNLFSPATVYSTRFVDNSLSGLTTLSWKVSDDALLYASYARGKKSGGMNLASLPAGVDPNVGPETVDNYEIGVKSQWFDRALTFNANAFWSEIRGYQTSIFVPISNVGYYQYIANIPKVRSRGIEFDMRAAPSRWVSVYASLAYADATFQAYRNAPQAPERGDEGPNQDLSGARLPGVPRIGWTIGADIALPLGTVGGRGMTFYMHGDYSHRSSFNTSPSNSIYADVPGYGLANARLGVRSADGLIDLSVWARNLFDKNYFQMLASGPNGLVTAILGEPRVVGLTLSTKL